MFEVIIIVFILLLYTATIIYVAFKYSKKIIPNKRTLNKFSVSFRYKEPPKRRIVEDTDCIPSKKRLCSISDPTTLLGCMNFATCNHYDVDTKYIDTTGEEFILPKNSTPDEGYAFPIENPDHKCNIYMGDIVIVSNDNKNSKFMLMCECKYPGYVDKTTVFGNCNNPLICNGRVDSLDKPLEQINCLCNEKATFSTHTPDGIPYCKEMTFAEAKEQLITCPEFDVGTLDIKVMDPTYQQNTCFTKSIDFCKQNIFDLTQIFDIGESKILNGGYYCANTFQGNSNKALMSFGIKANQSGSWSKNNYVADFSIQLTEYTFIAFQTNLDGGNIIIGVGKSDTEKFYKGLYKSILSNHQNMDTVGESTGKNLQAYSCTSKWPSYWCSQTTFHYVSNREKHGFLYKSAKAGPFGFTNYSKWNAFEHHYTSDLFQDNTDNVEKLGSFKINSDKFFSIPNDDFEEPFYPLYIGMNAAGQGIVVGQQENVYNFIKQLVTG